jgi:hypothetical protein
MKAHRLFHHKARIQEHFVLELDIFEVGDPVRYPDGIKYALFCMDGRSGRKILLDNHHPKGPHLHIDGTEAPYSFQGVPALMVDFKRMVLEYLGVKL